MPKITKAWELDPEVVDEILNTNDIGSINQLRKSAIAELNEEDYKSLGVVVRVMKTDENKTIPQCAEEIGIAPRTLQKKMKHGHRFKRAYTFAMWSADFTREEVNLGVRKLIAASFKSDNLTAAKGALDIAGKSFDYYEVNPIGSIPLIVQMNRETQNDLLSQGTGKNSALEDEDEEDSGS